MNKLKAIQLGTLLTATLLMGTAFLPVVNAQAGNNITPPTNDINLTGKNVVFFNVSGLTPIENGHKLIIQGSKTSTACKFPQTVLTITPSEGKITKIQRELAVNPDTCQLLVEQGTLANPPIQNTSEIKIKSSNSVQTYYYPRKRASFTTEWWDPVGIRVNYVFDLIDFNYDGTNTYLSSVGYDHWWYLTTHWYDVRYSTGSYAGSSYVDAYSYDHMENDWFGGVTTNVYYSPNEIYGLPDGTVSGDQSNTWDDGPIWFMLRTDNYLTVY